MLLNLLKHVLWPQVWSTLVNIRLSVRGRWILLLLGKVILRGHDIWLIGGICWFSRSWLIFCLLDLSVSRKGVLKSLWKGICLFLFEFRSPYLTVLRELYMVPVIKYGLGMCKESILSAVLLLHLSYYFFYIFKYFYISFIYIWHVCILTFGQRGGWSSGDHKECRGLNLCRHYVRLAP